MPPANHNPTAIGPHLAQLAALQQSIRHQAGKPTLTLLRACTPSCIIADDRNSTGSLIQHCLGCHYGPERAAHTPLCAAGATTRSSAP